MPQIDLTVDELSAHYALSDAHGIGVRRLRVLLSHFGSAQSILGASFKQLVEVEGIDKKTADSILQCRISSRDKEKAQRIKQENVNIYHFLNENYPSRLKQIPKVPVLLYSVGKFTEADNQAIAIVGTRSSSDYGHRVTKELVNELVQYGFTIVSGLARGIDTQAHYTALESGGRTIAVLGSGLDTIYPQENTRLARDVAGRGAICTEYYLGTQPDAPNFPERNRIISGLSLGTVVIEAGNKSGAIITALTALEQNREVFAIPGRIDSKRSIGTNRLIKHGAKLVQTVDDILVELTGQIQFQEGKTVQQSPPVDLTRDEQQIYDALSDEPIHIDVLSQKLELPTSSVLTKLLDLELRAIVEQLPGKQFVRK